MIEIETRKFVAAMDIAGSVVQRRGNIPVLGQMLVHANGSLVLSSTNLDVGCEVKLPYSGKPQAPFLLPAPGRIRKAVAHAGGAVVTLQTNAADQVQVSAGDLAVSSNGMPAEDFPDTELRSFAHESVQCVLGAPELAALARVARGISTEETRYYLNGIYFHAIDDWTIRAAATDGHRLFWANLKVPGAKIDRETFTGVIIPKGLIGRVLTRFKRCDEVAMVVGTHAPANAAPAAEGTAPARSGVMRAAFAAVLGDLAVTFRGKSIDGTYPDYQRVIPQRHDFRAVMEIPALRRAMQALLDGSGLKAPQVKFVHEGGALVCSIRASWGEGDLRMRVPLAEGSVLPEGYVVGFNARYLLDCLDGCRGKLVTLGLDKVPGPTSIGDDVDSDFGMVIMPVRV